MRHLKLPIKAFKIFEHQNIEEINENESQPSCSQEKSKPLKKRKKFKQSVEIPLVKRSKYVCKTCKHTEMTKKKMFKHLETHVGTPVSCLHCKKTFNGSLSYKWHLDYYCKLHNSFKLLHKCNQCTKAFICKSNLDRHLQGHKRNNCTYCDKVITKRIHLIKHLLEVHSIKLERKMHKCDYCEKQFIKKASLYYHLNQHIVDKFICLECGHLSNNFDDDILHKKGHDLKKNFFCKKCGERFSRRQQYLLHLKRHNQYKCNTCNENFASRQKIMLHKRLGHEIEGIFPKFLCSYCPSVFYRESKLTFHLRKHNDDNRLINCKYCKKSFTSPYAYYKHCITISHEKCSPETHNLLCKTCGKSFRKKFNLKHHIYRAHSEIKKIFNCRYCSYNTNNKCNLDRHVALHFRSNEFICEHCGKCFDNIATLKDHISYNHIQKKEYKCLQCGKMFKRNSELVRHIGTHSDYRPHNCSICGKSYKRGTHLKRHQETAHNIILPTRKVKKIDNTNDKITVHENILLNLDSGDALNIVDQLVNSFLPNENDELFDFYTTNEGDGNIL